ncbi:alkyl hydroperoxide reductase subunit F [Swaminathania salitolerans]|uniref:Thioredoxin reductase n=1 Tax=Swaminathania salitolerans TaxID=182838 RepID=A0A511BRJ6_9PROT|nr:alkyl hydroperoxide reductase subunit F [Swaminathania salitolerans]GBQ14145.1 alkyl hydroperoxide reductase [Swaminathania salitolerans LMG 21291]GEL02930.1 alkyl hydroperoxide reductase subunit F [Swaminathania salitolerans]
MLDTTLKDQLRGYLAHLRHDIVLEPSLDDSAKAQEMRALIDDIAGLSDRIAIGTAAEGARRPSFRIRRQAGTEAVTFAAIPMGHEFTSLVLALLQIGGHPPKIDAETAAQIGKLTGPLRFETYMSLSCQNCPDVVQALNAMAALNPGIEHTAIDGALFQEEVAERNIMTVPQIYLNGAPFASGRMDVDAILSRIDTEGASRKAERLSEKAPFEVLIVGAGPAGAAAAVYDARKGIRTGIVGERFGGQVLDTMAIENYISVPETEGPKLAAALEAHVRGYDVDITTGQRATALIPAAEPGGLHEIRFESGASLRSRSVILAPGARWRAMNVPGEDAYRNKGVAYCPHCDGPLFKGKRVAVIGGGNSGVEAAIDLAGLASEVTLLEFADVLRADSVLQDKLFSLPNVRVIMNAQTTEVEGDGTRVTALAYRDRPTGASHRIALEGIFVQIGLVPNTEWLQDSVVLSERGEIVVDTHNATSVPGIFAAGDATTTPFKQIIVATGEGAKAGLSAFDYLIRLPSVAAAA